MKFTSDIGLGMKFDIIHIFREINISMATISRKPRNQSVKLGGGGGRREKLSNTRQECNGLPFTDF